MDIDAIVIGGGHAGIEASLALARIGFSTLLVTQSLDAIGRLSCNPAVGGLAKGNLVREIDALGGEMARLIDRTMIQFRMLNKSKGPAVQAPRAQADKEAYALLAKHTLEGEKNLSLFQDTVTDLVLNKAGNAVEGVITARGKLFKARVVVLTTGTFMEGKIFIGDFSAPSGRLGEPAAEGLGTNLRRIGFEVGRLKTGTPARVLRRSLRLDKLEAQHGDEVNRSFAFFSPPPQRPSVPCYITYTTPRTHEIIRANIHRSPLYGGKIVGIGPRYCPSIEDKVMRFPDRTRHQIFVEPEGLATEEMYLNGISSSLPEEVQEEFLRTVPGLEEIVITRPGYAVEYDFLNPLQLYPSLETKRLAGLFVAGQTNGTSGYEEAAAQGLLAGLNAARRLQGKPPLVLSRAEAYIGVLIDDLVTLGTNEPYRLFTSRAEHRLSLRHDTADLRLFKKGYDAGLQGEENRARYREKRKKLDEIKELLEKRRVTGDDATRFSLPANANGKLFSVLLKDPEVRMTDLAAVEPQLLEFKEELLEQVELDIKYEGYIKKQENAVERVRRMERLTLPPDFDYDRIEGISAESREKFKKIRPLSVGQAARIPGVRNADVSVLIVFLGKKKRGGEVRGRPRPGKGKPVTDLMIPLREGLSALGIHAGKKELDRLAAYLLELDLWNKRFGFVKATLDELVSLHLFDALAGLDLLKTYVPHGKILDFGSGAGFPGLPLAFFLPGHQFVLCERKVKENAFLRNAVVLLGLSNVRVIDNLETVDPESVNAVVFRAITSLKDLYRIVRHTLLPGGILFAYKGKRDKIDKEIAELAPLGLRAVVHDVSAAGSGRERHIVVVKSVSANPRPGL